MKNVAKGISIVRWSAVPITFLLFAIAFMHMDRLGNAWSRIDPSWLFEGSKQDFQSWFPNFWNTAYWVVKIGPFLMLLLLALFVIRPITKNPQTNLNLSFRKSFVTIFGIDSELNGFRQQLLFQARTLSLSLVIFLLAYWVMRVQFGGLFDHQVLLTRGFLLSVLVQIAVSIIGQWELFKRTLNAFLFVPDSPLNLAILRIVFFGFMALVCWDYPKYFGAYFELDPVGLPYMNWYIRLIELTRDQYLILCRAGAIVNLLICVGLFTRPMLILNSFLIFVIIATPNFYGKLFHQHLWIWIPWIMTFSRCADTLSVDAFIRDKSLVARAQELSSDYSLPVRLIWLTFGVVYFFPGFQKLWISGFDWALSDSMLNQIYVEWNQHYGWRSFIPVENFPGLVKFGGLVIILFEMAFVFLLFNRKTRVIAVIGGILFHTLTGLILRIWFPPVFWMYAFFINWGKLFQRFLPTTNVIEESTSSLLQNRLMIALTGTLLFFNSVCGFASIYSYPFTSFPGYTTIYPSEIGVLFIEVKDPTAGWTSIDSILKKEGYRRENNTAFEQKIIDIYASGSIPEDEIKVYWDFLQAGVKPLKRIGHLRFYHQKIALHPKAEVRVLQQSLILEFQSDSLHH